MTAPVRSNDRPVSKERLEAAAEEGRRLAAWGVAGVQSLPADNPVEALARSSIARLREIGVASEVVRARRGCLVVRTSPRVEGYEAEACALVQAWLGALPAAVYGVSGTVAESSCGARGGRACMHTVMWQEPAGIRRLPLEPPNTAGAVPDTLRPPQSGGALPVPSPGAANPIPSPILAASPTVPAAPPPFSMQVSMQAPSPGVSLAPLDGGTASTSLPSLAPFPAYQHGKSAPPGDQHTGGSAGAPGTPASGSAPSDPSTAAPAGGRRFPWLRRRAWLVAIGVLAGSVGGFYASSRAGTAYTATSVLVVQANGATAATSSANGAQALAVTYAALIPDDQALLRRVAAELGVPATAMVHSLAVQSEAGTALVEIRFSWQDPATAVRGANDVAQLLSSGHPPGRAIAAGSVATVSSADAAAHSGTLHKYGLPLGVLGGLVVGIGAALVAERTDRRIDDLDALGSASDCSATVVPGGLTAAELARSLQRSGGDAVTVVPVRAEQHEAANDLAWAVRETWPGTAGGSAAVPEILVSPAFADAPQSVSAGTGQTVLVVGAGERAVAVREVVERLRLLGRGPTWAVLVSSGESRPDGRAR